MKAINIIWDVDYKEDLELLPTEMNIPDGMTNEDEISDYLSDETGFCHCGFELIDMEDLSMYYYDVVASICNETCRRDSHLICGGFDSEEEAMDYINEYDISEEDYYRFCNEGETVYIEIEVRNSLDGTICEVITVD